MVGFPEVVPVDSEAATRGTVRFVVGENRREPIFVFVITQDPVPLLIQGNQISLLLRFHYDTPNIEYRTPGLLFPGGPC